MKQPEKNMELPKEWEKDWFDFDFSSRDSRRGLLQRISSIGNATPDEAKVYDQLLNLQSLEFLNTELNSDHSPMKRIGLIFFMCRELLDRLMTHQYESEDTKVKFGALWTLLTGIRFLLKRFREIPKLLGIRVITPETRQITYLKSIFTIDEKQMSFFHISLDLQKYAKLSSGEPLNIPALLIKNTIAINVNDIKNIIAEQVTLPYQYLQPLLQFFNTRLNEIEYAEQYYSQYPEHPKHIELFCNPGLKIIKLITEPFLDYKTDFLQKEWEEISSELIFPDVLKELIRSYLDLDLTVMNFYNKITQKKWEKDWFDPVTDFAGFNNRGGNFALIDGLFRRMTSLRQTQEMSADHFIKLLPNTDINSRLTSPDSPMKKTGSLILLCRGMLDHLSNKIYQETKIIWNVLYCIIHGMRILLTRTLLNSHSIYIELSPSTAPLQLKFFDVEEKRMIFTHRVLDQNKFQDLLSGSLDNKSVDKLTISNRIEFNIDDIKDTIIELLPTFNHNILGKFIEYLSEYLNYLDILIPLVLPLVLDPDPIFQGEEEEEEEEKENVSRVRQGLISLRILDSITEPFMKYEADFLDEERKQLFNGLKLFRKKQNKIEQEKIEKLIHEYSELPGANFFLLKKEGRQKELVDLVSGSDLSKDPHLWFNF